MNAKDFYDYPDGFKVDHEVNNQNSIISTNDDYEPYFPYVPIDWETSYNLEVDMALNWAYTNCLFGVDPEWSKVAPGDVSIASMTKSAVPSVDGSVFKKLPMKKEFGRYGNFIYSDEVITMPSFIFPSMSVGIHQNLPSLRDYNFRYCRISKNKKT